MIEINVGLTTNVRVNYYKEDNYYVVICNEIDICSFYLEKDKLPHNSVLCFTNQNGSWSYITFYKEHLEILDKELTTLQYTEEDIKEAFGILKIKIKEVT